MLTDFCSTYPNPREANGRIVCANCHLAEKPVELEVPHGSSRYSFLKRWLKSHMINKSSKFRLMVKRRFKCWNGFTFTGRFELAPADRVPEQMKSWKAILPTI
jgi:apocytochrome f